MYRSLEERAAGLHKRALGLTSYEYTPIEELPTCPTCGHIKHTC